MSFQSWRQARGTAQWGEGTCQVLSLALHRHPLVLPGVAPEHNRGWPSPSKIKKAESDRNDDVWEVGPSGRGRVSPSTKSLGGDLSQAGWCSVGHLYPSPDCISDSDSGDTPWGIFLCLRTMPCVEGPQGPPPTRKLHAPTQYLSPRWSPSLWCVPPGRAAHAPAWTLCGRAGGRGAWEETLSLPWPDPPASLFLRPLEGVRLPSPFAGSWGWRLRRAFLFPDSSNTPSQHPAHVQPGGCGCRDPHVLTRARSSQP